MSKQTSFGWRTPKPAPKKEEENKPLFPGDRPCPYCPCHFVCDADLHAHLEAYGFDPEEHRRNWNKVTEHARRVWRGDNGV